MPQAVGVTGPLPPRDARRLPLYLPVYTIE
jgi:hypothetical protein